MRLPKYLPRGSHDKTDLEKTFLYLTVHWCKLVSRVLSLPPSREDPTNEVDSGACTGPIDHTNPPPCIVAKNRWQ